MAKASPGVVAVYTARDVEAAGFRPLPSMGVDALHARFRALASDGAVDAYEETFRGPALPAGTLADAEERRLAARGLPGTVTIRPHKPLAARLESGERAHAARRPAEVTGNLVADERQPRRPEPMQRAELAVRIPPLRREGREAGDLGRHRDAATRQRQHQQEHRHRPYFQSEQW